MDIMYIKVGKGKLARLGTLLGEDARVIMYITRLRCKLARLGNLYLWV